MHAGTGRVAGRMLAAFSRQLAGAFLLAFVVLAGGCASQQSLRAYGLPVARTELSATPFYAQTEHQCGPAALATVLVAGGAAVTPDELASQIYLPGREGSLQTEVIAATRRYGRVPYVLPANASSLLDEVAAGTPVLVLLNLGLKAWPQWHYAVLIGYDVDANVLLLRSGTTKNARMSRQRFFSSWARADNWAMVAALPDKPPVMATSTDWLRAAAAFEELRQAAVAASAYAAATRRWPEEPLAWQALANARYALRDLVGSEEALRESLHLQPSAAAGNNLALVLLERGCPTAARTAFANAEAAADAGKFLQELSHTRSTLQETTAGDAPTCPENFR